MDSATILSKQQLKLQIELIVNRKLYGNKKITRDTYSKTESVILREIENEKNRIKK